MLCYIMLCHIILYYIILYCIILYCILFYFIIFYSITFHCSICCHIKKVLEDAPGAGVAAGPQALARALAVVLERDASASWSADADERTWLQEVLSAAEEMEAPADLSEEELKLCRVLEGLLDSAAGPGKGQRRPPPLDGDTSEEAEMARSPELFAIQEAQRDMRSGLGTTELRPMRSRLRRSVALGELLQWAGVQGELAGEKGVQVTGLADVAELVQPGDAALLPWSDAETSSQGALRAAERGAVAVIFLAAEASMVGGELLAQAGGLAAVVAVPEQGAAAALAAAFFRGEGGAALPAVTAVVGGTPVEVRTASWLLSCLGLSRRGRERCAMISSRRTYVGQRCGHTFTIPSSCHLFEP